MKLMIAVLAGGAAWSQSIVVTSFSSDSVLMYNSRTQALTKTISGPRLRGPFAVIFGPDGNFYVSSTGMFVAPDGNLVPNQGAGFTNVVLRYNGTTGELIDDFVKP